MTLDGRDRAIVQYVARFNQLASAHIHELLFHEQASHTPADRALKRLVAQDYLARIERRIVGGSRGGSGQYVYQLGRRGFYLHFSGRYIPARAINYHSLAIADCYVILKQLERQGVFTILGVAVEWDAEVTIGHVKLRPDMRTDVARGDAVRLMWFEVDMGSEAQRKIRLKLDAYWRAYTEADDRQWPIFPQVVFVAVDSERAAELKWLVEQRSGPAQELFVVTTREQLHTLF